MYECMDGHVGEGVDEWADRWVHKAALVGLFCAGYSTMCSLYALWKSLPKYQVLWEEISCWLRSVVCREWHKGSKRKGRSIGEYHKKQE